MARVGNYKQQIMGRVTWLFTAAAIAMGVAIPSSAQTYKVLYSFVGSQGGQRPAAGLSMDRAGNLYGTLSQGGDYNDCHNEGCGMVFRLSKQGNGWVLSPIYTFHWSDGMAPAARVVFGHDGALYGTTVNGGNSGDACNNLFEGCGVLFKLTPAPTSCKSALCPWNETVLYRFAGNDGAFPGGEVAFDATGNLYLTTEQGGTNGLCNPYGIFGCGDVLEFSHSGNSWTENVLYNFNNDGVDGNQPFSNVVFDHFGNLYGTTSSGGVGGAGAVYELTPSGSGYVESVLFNQFSRTNGDAPLGGVVFDNSGNLLGTTSRADYQNDTVGTAFKLSPGNNDWTFNLLYSFPGTFVGAGGPNSGLTMDAAGNAYGTTVTSGAYEAGSVFKVAPDGTVTTLYDFCPGGYPCADGSVPYGSVSVDAQGNLFGTTYAGGAHDWGTVWEITP